MYIPRHFEVTDERKIYAYIEENAFGQLISSVGGRPISTHIPFLLSDDRTRLLGHLARKNSQASTIEGQEVLVTLQGPHDYISPSWYASPGVPTWNYQAAHIYGQCTVFNDPDRLKHLVDSLTAIYEQDSPNPWQAEYSPSMLGAILGIEIVISEIQCKYKLSQNRPAVDQRQVIEQLQRNGSTEMATVMQKNGVQHKS